MSIKKSIANKLAMFFKNPVIRYKFVLPLIELEMKNDHEKILGEAMKFAAEAGLDGDYLEFGVWKGRNFKMAYHMNQFIKDPRLRNMKFYAFDSFQGLPEISNPLDRKYDEFKKGDFSYDQISFKKVLKKSRVNLNRVFTVPGFYEHSLNNDTKTKLTVKKASIIYVDCDLYESTVLVLDFITDYVDDGTIIIFDDWYNFRGNPNLGEQRAFREWLERNPRIGANEWLKGNWEMNSFILYKK